LTIYANQGVENVILARMGRTKTTEAFCPFGQVPRFRNAAGNATLACGYENFVLSGHFNF
jgi:hypothetical protein